MRVRRADPGDGAWLREIAERSKGHWGYEEQRVRKWAAALDLSWEIWVAEEAGAPIAWLALLPPDEDGSVNLTDLWVDPPAMGRRVGTELFRFACERARELGGLALLWEAEPNAVGFYERMGGKSIGVVTGSWGRELPVMSVAL